MLDDQAVVGHLTTLEDLAHPDLAMFATDESTPKVSRITTIFVSTAKEESLLESAPAIVWPPVREGKTDGYMIVYARTDRTGQVRETSKHNSDQPGQESFGMEQALRYKFKPLVVGGVAQQMEMPLVLHFSTHPQDPVPVLSAEQMEKQMGTCEIARRTAGGHSGDSVRVRFSVDETGKITGYGPVGETSDSRWIGPVSAMGM